MLPEETNLERFYQKYTLWMEIYHRAEMLFKQIGDNKSLHRLRQIQNDIQELHDERIDLYRQKFEEFLNMAHKKDYPHSLKTWLEDEYNDLDPDSKVVTL